MSEIVDVRGAEPDALQYSTGVVLQREGGVRVRGRDRLAAVLLIGAMGLTAVVGTIVIVADLPRDWQPEPVRYLDFEASGNAQVAPRQMWIVADVEDGDAEAVVFLLVAVVFGSTGAVLALRRPENALLWIMAVSGLLVAISAPGATWNPPGGQAAATIGYLTSNGAFFVGLALLVCFFPMLFPDGTVPTRRWRWLHWLGVVAVVDAAAWAMLVTVDELGAGYWPFGSIPSDSPAAAMLGMGFLLVFASVLGGIAALAVRYRRGNAEMRKRIRLPMLAVALWLPFFIVISVALERTEIGETFGILVNLALPLLLVASMGVAITRYGLYDIDRIVGRTVTYGIVVIFLAALFALGTVWLPQQLPTANNNLAVAASTLAVAALFTPLRRRVQGVVDRRFNRLPYDPEAVTSLLSTRLRSAIDPGAVGASFASTVGSVIEPATVAIWIRES